jgi:hypothetical protein
MLLKWLYIYIETREWPLVDSFRQGLTCQSPSRHQRGCRQEWFVPSFLSPLQMTINWSTPILAQHTTITTWLTHCCPGRPTRCIQQQQQSSPAPAATATALMQPEETELDSQLEQMVLRITNECRPDSTSWRRSLPHTLQLRNTTK